MLRLSASACEECGHGKHWLKTFSVLELESCVQEPAQINLLAHATSLDMHNSFSVLSVEDTPTDTIVEACPVSPNAAELAAMALQQGHSAAVGGKSILGITSGALLPAMRYQSKTSLSCREACCIASI